MWARGSGAKAADVPHHHEHGVLHGRVGDGPEVPEPPGEQNVEIAGHEADLAEDHLFAVIGPQRCQQEHRLEGKALLCVVEQVFEAGYGPLRRLDQAQIVAAIEVEVAVDEAEEVAAVREPYGRGGVAQPAVELGANAIEVLGLRALLALADLDGVLAAEPGFETVGLHLLARVVELADPVAPAGIGCGALGLVDVGQQVAFEHVRGTEREPAIIHRLEDRVGVVVGVGGDLDQMDILQQPVDEVRKGGLAQLLGEVGLQVVVALHEVLHRLGTVGHVEGLAFVERVHGRGALIDMEVEGLLPVAFREDQLVHIDLLGMVLLQVSEQHKEQRQAGEPLLAVHDVADTLLLADDDETEEVVRVVGDLAARVGWLVLLQELVAEVVKQLVDLLLVPLVLALVVVDRVLHALEQLADRLGLAEDLSHVAATFSRPSSSPSASRSTARISALISSRVRSGCGL